MDGAVICCSGLKGDEREEIYQLIQLMNGRICRDFTTDVTHLVTNTTSSEKYAAAVKLQRPVVKPDWVYDSWNAFQAAAEAKRSPQRPRQPQQQQQQRHYQQYNNHHHPQGFNALSRVSEYLLPIFMGCTICVTGMSSEEKAKVEEFTRNNGGLYSSDLTKSCTHLLTAAPTGAKFETALKWNIFTVSVDWFYDSLSMNGCAEERYYLIPPGVGMADPLPALAPPPLLQSALKDGSKALPTPPTAPYLQDLFIFLGPGFSRETFEHLGKIVREGGATQATQVSSGITHYIVSNATLSELDRELLAPYLPSQKRAKLPFGSFPGAHFAVVSASWLRECYKKDRLVPLKGYEVNTFSEPDQESAEVVTIVDLQDRERAGDNIFEGRSFRVDGFSTTEAALIKQLVISHKGDLAGGEDPADVVVLPFSDPNPRNLKDQALGQVRSRPSTSAAARNPHTPHRRSPLLVTEYWLERCLRDKEFVAPSDNVIFRPCEFPLPLPSFSDCVISLTGFEGLEREHISRLVELLGGRFTDRFSRKNTHLICLTPQGQKFQHAVKWSIPAIEVQWLYTCAAEGTVLPVGGFLFATPPPPFAVSAAMAVKRLGDPHHHHETPEPEISHDDHHHHYHHPEEDHPQQPESTVLADVVICVSPKLLPRLAELQKLAVSLGGRCNYSYDATCTHLIHEGNKPNETFKEIKQARTAGKFIVSPHWLTECKHRGQRMREMDFPPTFNPSKVLSILPPQPSPVKVEPTAPAEQKRPSLEKRSVALATAVDPPRSDAPTSAQGMAGQKGKEKMKFEEEIVPPKTTVPAAAASKGQGGEPKPMPVMKPALPDSPETTTNPSVPVKQKQQQHQKMETSFTESSESVDFESCLEDIIMATEKVRKSYRKAQLAKRTSAAAAAASTPISAPMSNKRKSPEGEQGFEETTESPGVKKRSRLEGGRHSAVSLSKIEGKPSFHESIDDILAQESASPSNSQIPVGYEDRAGKRIPARATPSSKKKPQKKSPAEYIFHLSGMTADLKAACSAIIQQLGGKLIDSMQFDASCTHLVLGAPSRSEKYLACCASGIWALTQKYLEDSKKAGHFLPEESYEWTHNMSPKKDEPALYGAARKWRLLAEKRGANWKGAFSEFTVILAIHDKGKKEGFERLLRAGGGTVIAFDPNKPSEPVPEAKMALVDQTYKSKPDLLRRLAANGIDCLNHEYLSEFLCSEKSPSPSKYKVQVRN